MYKQSQLNLKNICYISQYKIVVTKKSPLNKKRQNKSINIMFLLV